MPFFCPYTGVEQPDEDASLEHVVPEAIGGSRNFAIRVQKLANNTLGSAVDGKVLRLYAHHRVKHDLRGHSGKPPKVEMSFKVEALGGHEGTLEWGVEGPAVVSLKTKVEKTPNPDGSISVHVSGEPEKARALVAAMIAAYEARGKKATFNEAQVQTIEQPKVQGEFLFDLVVMARFDLKLAIGAMHWITDGKWSCEPSAEKLRQGLWSTTEEAINALGIECGMRAPSDLQLTLAEHEHGFFCSPAASLGHAIGVFMFGGEGRCTVVADPGVPTCLTADPILVILDTKTGDVQKLVGVELVRQGRMKI